VLLTLNNGKRSAYFYTILYLDFDQSGLKIVCA